MSLFTAVRFVHVPVVVLCVTCALGSCVPLAPVVLGGAFAGSVMVATDRRTAGIQVEDEGIELRSSSTLNANVKENVHVNVTSYNRQVLLTGEVPSPQLKASIGKLIATVENVASVVNELAVLGNSSLTSRSGDSLVTTRVKAGLTEDRDLSANAFKIVTERGTVYMMGRVTEREALQATEIARRQSGVLRVVRVLEIISEEELARMRPKPPAEPPAQKPTPIRSGAGINWNE